MKILQLVTICIAAAIACAVAWTAKADPVESDVVFVTLKADGSTNTWTQANLVAALGLLNRKYHRDCQTVSGRRAWHGKLKREMIDEEAQIKIQTFEDGTAFTNKWKIVTPSVAVSNANRKVLVNTNGIPARLAQARMRRAQEKATTNIVTQVLTPGS